MSKYQSCHLFFFFFSQFANFQFGWSVHSITFNLVYKDFYQRNTFLWEGFKKEMLSEILINWKSALVFNELTLKHLTRYNKLQSCSLVFIHTQFLLALAQVKTFGRLVLSGQMLTVEISKWAFSESFLKVNTLGSLKMLIQLSRSIARHQAS